jgi:4-amino-4-deoxy-L-arabinose transferase-like glycosyltransferase
LKNKLIYYLLFFSLICKLLLAYFIPVFGDEAYYYIWSQHPQLSYFDHPAMVSWFIYAGHLFFPEGNPISLRISFVIASFLISLIWVEILNFKKLSAESIVFFLVLLFLNPLLGLGSILATPDTPLVLFWTLSYYGYLKILASSHLSWYVLLGVFLGLGFCSKYHIVLFVISGLIYLILSKKIFSLKPVGVLLTVIFGLIFCSPVLIWNSQNEWSSFLFQINHGFGESSFEWAWPLGYLVAQFLAINPIIFFSFFKKGISYIDKTFSISQLTFFFISSFKSVVEGNWPLTSHLHSITHFTSLNSKKNFKMASIYWVVFYLLIGVFFLLPASHKVRKNLINSAQFDDVIQIMDQYQPLYGPSYQVSSLLTWTTGKNTPKLSQLSRHDFYDSLPESTPVARSFYVLKNDYSDWPEKYIKYRKIKIRSFDNSGLELYQFIYE